MKSVLLILALSLILIFPVKVGAQTDPTTQPTSAENLIFSRSPVTQQIEDLKKTYRGQLETYRTTERQYLLAKGQYTQLKTLVALEVVVKASREAIVARNLVLTTYLSLLRLQLIEATGINLNQKDQALKDLESLISDLKTYQTQAEAIADRNQLLQAAVAFKPLGPRTEEVAYQSASLLAIGKIQTVYDKALPLSQEVIAIASSNSAGLKKGEVERAAQETERELAEVRDTLTELNQEMESSNNRDYSRSSYSQVLQQLGTVYVGLTQSLNYIQELLKI